MVVLMLRIIFTTAMTSVLPVMPTIVISQKKIIVTSRCVVWLDSFCWQSCTLQFEVELSLNVEDIVVSFCYFSYTLSGQFETVVSPEERAKIKSFKAKQKNSY